MAETVYILCSLTSIGCAALLLKSYFRSRTRLLFWSGACFVALALTNTLLFVDLVVVPQYDLSALRNSIALGGLLMLIYGLIWDAG
jgi:hypothetical protein